MTYRLTREVSYPVKKISNSAVWRRVATLQRKLRDWTPGKAPETIPDRLDSIFMIFLSRLEKEKIFTPPEIVLGVHLTPLDRKRHWPFKFPRE